ncbi:MAG TPA: outer membrane beta-barrel protein [Puia sp.]|nr:outer membrane beta-barrel protein [Puia sp.]
MLLKLSATVTALLLFIVGYSQVSDSTKKTAAVADSAAKPPATPPPVAITGSVDVYYRVNSGGSKYPNNYTSFTNSVNSFELGMASIRGDHSFGAVSATVDLGFGRRAEEFSYNDGGHPTLFAVKQLFLAWQATSKLKFTMGKWGTHIGYEVVDAFSNRNYSMDYMFSYGPFFHTGLKADVTLSGTTAFMVGIANPTDFSTTVSSTKVAIAQFSTGTKSGKWKFFLNYQGYSGVSQPEQINPTGPSYTLYKSLNQFDLVINGTLSGKFGIGYNGTVQTINDGASKSWWGSALYLNFDPTSKFGLTLRGEYFSDKDGVKINPIDLAADPNQTPGLNVVDLTLSGNVKIGNLTIIPEVRLDNGSKNFFNKSDGSYTQSTFSALLAAVYHF